MDKTSDLVHLPFYIQGQLQKLLLGAEMPLMSGQSRRIARIIRKGAIPLPLTSCEQRHLYQHFNCRVTSAHTEIWQTQNRLYSGRAGEIPAISSISPLSSCPQIRASVFSPLSSRPQIRASVLKGVRKNPFPIHTGYSIYFSCVLTYTTFSNTHLG